MNQEVDALIKAASRGASYRQMGTDSGISYSTIRRQLTGEGELTAQVVVALARTYKVNVLEALTAAGFITKDEAGVPRISDALHMATDLELAREIMRRAANGTAGEDLTGPMPDVPSLDDARAAKNVSGPSDTSDIPENVEDAWRDKIAADPSGDDPIDHGTP